MLTKAQLVEAYKIFCQCDLHAMDTDGHHVPWTEAVEMAVNDAAFWREALAPERPKAPQTTPAQDEGAE